MQFTKAHGTGNDFVLLPDPDDQIELTPALVRALCDRHLGVGGDGVIRLGPARHGVAADVFMDYRNADGSLAEMCGNGVRCVAKYIADRGHTGQQVRVDTRAGVKHVEVVAWHEDGTVDTLRVDMGPPSAIESIRIELEDAGDIELTTVSMGNPHAVIAMGDVTAASLEQWGRAINADERFPDGVNVEVIAVPSLDRVEGRIYERGVGETLASGTGAAAMAVAAHTRGLATREVTVDLPGGQLEIAWGDSTLHVTGPAREVASGVISPAWLAGSSSPEGEPVKEVV